MGHYEKRTKIEKIVIGCIIGPIAFGLLGSYYFGMPTLFLLLLEFLIFYSVGLAIYSSERLKKLDIKQNNPVIAFYAPIFVFAVFGAAFFRNPEWGKNFFGIMMTMAGFLLLGYTVASLSYYQAMKDKIEEYEILLKTKIELNDNKGSG